jgi:type IX secretion system PorP/SprF family membrane protein
MNLKQNILLVFIACLSINLNVSGQDPGFSQIFSNQLYLNPAYAGNPFYMRSRLLFRNQWLTSNSPYTTYGVSFDKYFLKSDNGLGFNIINDRQAQGSLNRLSADVVYSYTVQVTYDFQLRGGIQAGGIFRSQNTSNLIFPDMIDPTGEVVGVPGFSGQSRVIPDFAMGIAGEWNIFYGGIAIHHLAQPIEAKYGHEKVVLPRKYTVNMGCEINLYKKYLFRKYLILSPNILYQQQQDFRQINFGLYLYHQKITIGLWVKENLSLASHTFAFLAGYHNDSFSAGYSYDFSIFQGGFRGINTSTHEVTFGKNFKYNTRVRKKLRYIKSPKI